MPLLDDVDVLTEVIRGRIPAAIARREKLVTLRSEALALVREAGLMRARASWRTVPLEGQPGEAGRLCADGEVLHAPWLVPASGELTGVACAVLTIGPKLEEHVSQLFAQRKVTLAVALDGVGNELLFALSRKVQDRMFAGVRRQGLTMAGELRAGDPGLALSAQQTVLKLAGADQIGVTVTRTQMMNPTKSSTIVQGVGHDLPKVTWSRCDDCRSRERCAIARENARENV
jgi:hypothetical protein